MKITKSLFHAGVLGLSLLATSVMAAVPAAEADKLGKSLTPMGAEMAGNADGSIPAWKPMPKNAGSVDSKGFLSNPYASEKPLFTITAQNVDQYKDKLAPGQYAMFKRYPETFKMPVYPSHRGATVPDDVFAAIKRNATNTNLVSGGNGLENFETAVPFPIPKSGVEVIWNHITRVPRQDEGLRPEKPGQHPVLLQAESDRAGASGRWCAAGPRNPRPGQGTAFGVGLQRRSASCASCAASVL
jgi:hypothetical protein